MEGEDDRRDMEGEGDRRYMEGRVTGGTWRRG